MRAESAFRSAILLLSLGLSVAIFLGIRHFILPNYIAGVVIDSDTALPLPTTNIAVSNRGWGFIRGSLVWDKDYIYRTVSDEAGRFRISYRE